MATTAYTLTTSGVTTRSNSLTKETQRLIWRSPAGFKEGDSVQVAEQTGATPYAVDIRAITAGTGVAEGTKGTAVRAGNIFQCNGAYGSEGGTQIWEIEYSYRDV